MYLCFPYRRVNLQTPHFFWIGQLRIDCTYFSKSSELIMQVYMLHSTMAFKGYEVNYH